MSEPAGIEQPPTIGSRFAISCSATVTHADGTTDRDDEVPGADGEARA